MIELYHKLLNRGQLQSVLCDNPLILLSYSLTMVPIENTGCPMYHSVLQSISYYILIFRKLYYFSTIIRLKFKQNFDENGKTVYEKYSKF